MDQIYLESNKNLNIKIRGGAFFLLYEIPFWIQIDSLSWTESSLDIFYRATTYIENNNYNYFLAKSYFDLSNTKPALKSTILLNNYYFEPERHENEDLYININEELKKAKKRNKWKIKCRQ